MRNIIVKLQTRQRRQTGPSGGTSLQISLLVLAASTFHLGWLSDPLALGDPTSLAVGAVLLRLPQTLLAFAYGLTVNNLIQVATSAGQSSCWFATIRALNVFWLVVLLLIITPIYVIINVFHHETLGLLVLELSLWGSLLLFWWLITIMWARRAVSTLKKYRQQATRHSPSFTTAITRSLWFSRSAAVGLPFMVIFAGVMVFKRLGPGNAPLLYLGYLLFQHAIFQGGLSALLLYFASATAKQSPSRRRLLEGQPPRNKVSAVRSAGVHIPADTPAPHASV